MLLETIIFLGTYTKATEGVPAGEGIYVCRMAPDGSLQLASIARGIVNPTFLAVNKAGTRVYAVCETTSFGDNPVGGVMAFAFDRINMTLTALNEQPTQTVGPCHIILDRSEQWLLVANYRGGASTVLPLREDGSIGPASQFIPYEGKSVNPKRQEMAHAHSTALDPSNRFAFVQDLGSDKIWQFRFDALQGQLLPNDPPFVSIRPGEGPRHFAFHPNGRWAYANNELGNSVVAFDLDPKQGTLREKQYISTLPKDFTGGSTTAEILVSQDGRFVYCSNRGHDSIAIFAVDPQTGVLTLVDCTPSGGRIPRNFNLHPDGHLLFAAHQDSDNVVTFNVDRASGRIAPTGSEIRIPRCVCVKFLKIQH